MYTFTDRDTGANTVFLGHFHKFIYLVQLLVTPCLRFNEFKECPSNALTVLTLLAVKNSVNVIIIIIIFSQNLQDRIISIEKLKHLNGFQ